MHIGKPGRWIAALAGLLLGWSGQVPTALHLLARADIAPESGRVRAGTILLGWNAF